MSFLLIQTNEIPPAVEVGREGGLGLLLCPQLEAVLDLLQLQLFVVQTEDLLPQLPLLGAERGRPLPHLPGHRVEVRESRKDTT